MYYAMMENGKAVRATLDPGASREYEYRADWKTFERAAEIAAQLTEATGERWIATDAGAHTSPRYDIARVPTVGEKVSRTFNGDTYPCGEIASISKTLKKIVTTDGTVFYRKRLTGAWSDGTFYMVTGHIHEQNPSF